MPGRCCSQSNYANFFSAASFDTGSVIGGVYLSINDGLLEAVATDGNRLAYRNDLLNISNIAAKSSSLADDSLGADSKSNESKSTGGTTTAH